MTKRLGAIRSIAATVCCAMSLAACGSSHGRPHSGEEAAGGAAANASDAGAGSGGELSGSGGSTGGSSGGGGVPTDGSAGNEGSTDAGEHSGGRSGAGGDTAGVAAGGTPARGGSGGVGASAGNSGSPSEGGASNAGSGAGDNTGNAGAAGEGGAENAGAAGEGGTENTGVAGEGGTGNAGAAGEGGARTAGAAGEGSAGDAGASGQGGSGDSEPECSSGSEQNRSCGLNDAGISTRTCSAGIWGGWSACADPDVCTNGDTNRQPCGLNLRGSAARVCVAGAWGQLGACSDPDTCVDDAADERACGLNGRGQQRRTCVTGSWSSWSSCVDPDMCVDGSIDEGACGLNARGERSRTCTSGAFGSWSLCQDPDECRDGEERSVACGAGSGAHRTESCELGAWTASQACSCDSAWQILKCDGTCGDTPERVYVDADNTGCADGTSWATALPKLTTALDEPYAQALEFWVAEGTYHTGEIGDSTSSSFALSGHSLYGGFAGHELSLDERDPALYTTVLSGDLNRSGSADSGDSDSVVTATELSASIDGFTITSGYAPAYGGGLYAEDAYVRVRRCVFEGNQAGYGGGAISVSGDLGIDVIDSTFTNNNAYQQYNTSAGVIQLSGNGATAEASQPLTTIFNSVFYDNNKGPADAEGEVISASYARATIVNSLFYGNVLRCRSAISAELHGTVRIYDSTIANNDWRCGSCATCVPGASSFYGGDLYLTNVIARDRVTAHNGSSNPTATLKAIYTNHPTPLPGTGNTTTVPVFVDVAAGNYCLSSGSGGINAGSSDLLPTDNIDLDDDDDLTEAIPLDLLGQPRVSGGQVDQGACEFQQ